MSCGRCIYAQISIPVKCLFVHLPVYRNNSTASALSVAFLAGPDSKEAAVDLLFEQYGFLRLLVVELGEGGLLFATFI